MPYVNIKITKEGATLEQKAQLIQGATQLLVDVLGKDPRTTVVVLMRWLRITGGSAEKRLPRCEKELEKQSLITAQP